MIEKYLIEYCSPTLARLKTANLFSISYTDREELSSQISICNQQLNEKGIYVTILRMGGEKALIYVYRKSRLEKELQGRETSEFLASYGYEEFTAAYAIARLRERFSKREDFPHEIGVFLGYPLGDVKGFIQHQGRHYKCAGCWKVYQDEGEARKLFGKFRKCRAVYQELFQKGRSVWQLTVAA